MLWGVAYLLGLDPRANLQKPQARALGAAINGRVREAWEHYPWPELIRTEQRQYRSTWNGALTYDDGAEVWNGTGYYRSLAAANLGNAVTNALWWAPIAEIDHLLPIDEAGLTPIGEVLAIAERDPRTTHNPRSLDFWIQNNGVQLHNHAPASVWIRYRIRPSEFSGDSYDPTVSYAPGEVVYLPDDGECYKAIDGSTDAFPLLSPDYWTLQPFPYIFAPFVKHAAYSDALREDGQHDKALREEAHARRRLEDEIMKIVTQQRQSARRFGVAA